MRIACDARPLLGARTGVGVWLEGLLRGLAERTDWELVLCLPRRETALGLDDLGARAAVLAPPVPEPGTIWLNTLAGPLLSGRADAYLATLGILPRRLEVPAVLMVHDLTPRTRPRQHTLANRFCFNAYLEGSLGVADEVVCLSRATRDRLAEVWPQQARRAHVIGAGVDAFFTPDAAGGEAAATSRRFAAGRPYVVQLGTLEPRKGLATLLEAHGLLLARPGGAPDLVLAGRTGWGGRWLERALAAHPDRDRVHLPGYVGRDDARALLRHAEVVVVASEEEGFGLPLAQALACGAACVISDAAALVEVAGGAAVTVATGDPRALAAGIAEALTPSRQAELQRLALDRGRRLGWDGPLESWRSLLADLASASH